MEANNTTEEKIAPVVSLLSRMKWKKQSHQKILVALLLEKN